MNIVVVVANVFKKTAQNNGVIVLDELLGLLENKERSD